MLQGTGEQRLPLGASRGFFTTGLTLPAALPVQGAVFHAGIKVRGGVRGPLSGPPEADERFLHDVFGVGAARNPLPREQDQRGTVLVEPDRPVIGTACHVPSPVAEKNSLSSRRRRAAILFTRAKKRRGSAATGPARFRVEVASRKDYAEGGHQRDASMS